MLDFQQDRRRLLSQKHRQEGHRHHESVSHPQCFVWESVPLLMVNRIINRLLDIYNKLRDVVAATSNEIIKNEIIEEAKTTIEEICSDHIDAAQASVKNPEIQKDVCENIQKDCQMLIDYILATRRFNLEVNARSKDRVVSFGERLSCRFMTAMLKDNVCAVLVPTT